MQIGAGFPMNADLVGPRVGKSLQMALRLDDHQVNVQRQRRHAAHRAHDQRPHRDVRHELPIHHINMNQITPGGLGFLNLLAQPGEIGREN